jgi:DNA repair exonuclease SbcCD ATPase subunit
MIVFKQVSYQNFLSTGNAFITVPLSKHKNTLIIGENGSGKSTVLEAISYALYGKPLRNINKPQLVNSVIGKNMLVILDFSIGSREYQIKRGQKPNIFEIYQDGVLLNQEAASKDYQEMLETQILRRSHKSFSQIEVLSIANYTPFMKLSAAGRREIIEDLLDIQIFSVMNSLLKERIDANKTAIQTCDYEIKLIENKIELHKRHMAEVAKNNTETVNKKRQQIKGYLDENRKYNDENKTLSESIKADQERLQASAKTETSLKECQDLERKVNSLKKRYNADISFYETNSHCPTCKQEIDDDFKAGEVSKKRTLLVEAEAAMEKLAKRVSRLSVDQERFLEVSTRINNMNRRVSDNNVKVATNNKFVATIESEIRSLEEKIVKAKTDDAALKTFTDELTHEKTTKENLIRDREVLSLAAGLLKDGGIKTKIIKQYIPIMNKLINRYLALMDFFVEFNIDETFKETIKSRFRDEFTYDSFSQGEKLRIDLALLFTWRAIAKIRNSSSSNLLFMDEILDSSLDAGGVDVFLKIIENLTNDTNVFIISHRGDQMVDKFENIIAFQKHKNFTTMAA